MPDQIKDMSELFAEEEDKAVAAHRAWLADPVAQAAERERVEAMIARQPEDAADEDDDVDDVEEDDDVDDGDD